MDNERERDGLLDRRDHHMRRGGGGRDPRQARPADDALQVAERAMVRRAGWCGCFDLLTGRVMPDQRGPVEVGARAVIVRHRVVRGDPHGGLAGQKARQGNPRHDAPETLHVWQGLYQGRAAPR